MGGAVYATIGTEGSTGPKLFCVSGHVARPGVYETEFGSTLGDLIELAGGVPGNRRIQAILLGGAAGAFVGRDSLGTRMTFEGTRAAGATLGSGVVMVFDETADLPGALRRIAAFFRDESCGQCVPCRVGTVRQEELLARLAAGRPDGLGRPRSSPCSTTWRGRCATPRSAASARRRRRPSRARSRAGSCTSRRWAREHARHLADLHRAPGAAVAGTRGAARPRWSPSIELTHRRRARHRSPPARRSSRPPARSASTRPRCATSRTSPRSTCAGCAWSR